MYENKCSKCEPFEVEKIKECQNKENCIYNAKFAKLVEGVEKDAPIVANENGGKQSQTVYALHLIDPNFMSNLLDYYMKNEFIQKLTGFMERGFNFNLLDAIKALYQEQHKAVLENLIPHKILLEVGKVLKEGAEKYEPNNWRLIPQEEHINHALIHYIAYKMGDTQDNHFGHCLTRLMMAYCTETSKDFYYNKHKSTVNKDDNGTD